MRCYWEKVGILGPIYDLLSQGFSDREIASKLNIPEVKVRGCISWLLHFLKCQTRAELVLYGLSAQQGTWGLRAAA